MTRTFILKTTGNLSSEFEFEGENTIFKEEEPTDVGDNITRGVFSFDGITNLTNNYPCASVDVDWDRGLNAVWPPIIYNVYYNEGSSAFNGSNTSTYYTNNGITLTANDGVTYNEPFCVGVRATNSSLNPYEEQNTNELCISPTFPSDGVSFNFSTSDWKSSQKTEPIPNCIMPNGTYTLAIWGWYSLNTGTRPANPNTTLCGVHAYTNVACCGYWSPNQTSGPLVLDLGMNNFTGVSGYYDYSIPQICQNRSLDGQFGYGHFYLPSPYKIKFWVNDSPLWDNAGNTTFTLWWGTKTSGF